MSGTPLWLGLCTLLIAVAGLLTTIRQWYLNGPRVKVNLSTATVVHANGDWVPTLVVELLNAGRGATRIQSIGLVGPGAFRSVTQGQKLPEKLESHERRMWTTSMWDTVDRILENDPTADVVIRAEVRFGPNRKRSRERFRIRGDQPRNQQIQECPKPRFLATNPFPVSTIVLQTYERPSKPRADGLAMNVCMVVKSFGHWPIFNLRAKAVSASSRQMAAEQVETMARFAVRKWVLWSYRPWKIPLGAELLSIAEQFPVGVKVRSGTTMVSGTASVAEAAELRSLDLTQRGPGQQGGSLAEPPIDQEHG